MAESEKVSCRTPTKGKSGVTRIPAWKYDCVSRAILKAVRDAGAAGMPFGDLTEAVSGRLSTAEREKLGSVGWHVATVKLEMEVRGELTRGSETGPQRLYLSART